MIEYYWDLIQESKEKRAQKKMIFKITRSISSIQIFFLPMVYWGLENREMLKIAEIISSILVYSIILSLITIINFYTLKRYSKKEYNNYVGMSSLIYLILSFLFALNFDIFTLFAINLVSICLSDYFVVVKHSLDKELKSAKFLYAYIAVVLIFIVFFSL